MERALKEAQAQQAGEATTITHPDCERLDMLINTLDETFADFEKQISEFIDESDLPEELKTRLKQPFATYNQYRNLGQERNWTRSGSPKHHLTIFDSSDLFMGFKDNHDIPNNGYAMFQPICRTIYLPRDFNPYDNFDLLVLYHELVHVMQDNHARHLYFSNLDKDMIEERIDMYLNTESSNAQNTNREAEAYGLQLETLDIIFEGQLRSNKKALREIKNAKKHALLKKLIERASTHPDLINMLRNIFDFAQCFFPDGMRGEYQPQYLMAIRNSVDESKASAPFI